MNDILDLRTVETGDFSPNLKLLIHPIRTSRQLFDVYKLTYQCYYGCDQNWPRPDGLWIPHPDFDHIAETTILVAEVQEQIVGSISITLDGTRGLPLDSAFFRTCMLVRSQRRRLAQVWRLLIKETYPETEALLTSLMAAAVHHLLLENIQTALIVAPEKHGNLCRELLNAVTLMRAQSAQGIPDASSVLMRSELDNLKCALPNSKEVSVERAPHSRRR